MNVNILVRPTFARVAFSHITVFDSVTTATLLRVHPLLNNRESKKTGLF